MRIVSYISLTAVLLAVACSPGAVPTASDTEKYKEDLSYLRPTYPNPTDTMYSTPADSTSDLKPPVAPTFDVTAQLNAILDSIDVIRKDQQFVDGYTIQVYSGGDSEEATKARGKVYSILEGAKPSLKFEEPNFKVKVGEYYSRLEAQKDYALLKRKFSLALIIPERIYIQ